MITLSRSCLRQASRNLKRVVLPVYARWNSTISAGGRQWSTPLAKSLGEAITTTGPISVASYMRQCLTSPDGGYYTSLAEGHDPFGQKGDFITSPEISQVFGELIGIWVVAEWMAQGKKSSGVNIIELGPGRGTLMNDMLRTIANFPSLAKAIDKVYLIEASPHLREAQRKLLCGNNDMREIEIGYQSTSKYGISMNIVWCEDIKFVPKVNDSTPFIIAHEFFDALPIHVFQSVPSPTTGITTSATATPQKSPNEWREVLVAPVSPYSTPPTTKSPSTEPRPEFTLVVSKEPTPYSKLLPMTSPRYKVLLPHTGSTVEISPESLTLAADIATRISGPNATPQTTNPPREPSGAALILDYGPLSTIPANSLRGIKAHAPISPFVLPGQVDISADVDFMALAEAAINASHGIAVHGPVEQSAFLLSMGIKERAEMLMRATKDDESKKRIEGAWKRLVDRGPRGMGKLYKVIAIVPFREVEQVRRPVGFGDVMPST